ALREPVASPSAGVWPSMAYDLLRQRVVLFGGAPSITGSGAFGDTWEWDGTNWTQQQPATAPPARSSAAMTFDLQRNRVVLFGGGGTTFLGDTWEWDGAVWTQPSTSGPPARSGPAMSFTPSGRVILFGGYNLVDDYLADTWEWSGGAWIELQKTSPGTRIESAVGFDP